MTPADRSEYNDVILESNDEPNPLIVTELKPILIEKPTNYMNLLPIDIIDKIYEMKKGMELDDWRNKMTKTLYLINKLPKPHEYFWVKERLNISYGRFIVKLSIRNNKFYNEGKEIRTMH